MSFEDPAEGLVNNARFDEEIVGSGLAICNCC